MSTEDFSAELRAALQPVGVPGPVAAELEEFSRIVEALSAGGTADLSSAAKRLSRLSRWTKARNDFPPEASYGWSAEYLGLEGAGGTLVSRGPADELSISLDPSGVPCHGAWSSLRPGEENRHAAFHVEGGRLELDDGRSRQSYELPEAGAIGWGTLPGSVAAVTARPAPPPPAAPRIACPQCNAPAPPGTRFCKACGATLAGRFCRQCGASSPAGMKFCKACGASILPR